MTDREYLTDRTRDQIADALGGAALADIFTPLWNAVGQDEAEQLQAIGYALGKLPNLDEWPAHPITPYDAAIITAHLQMIPAFYGEFPLKAQARTIHCMLAIAGRLHSCRGHRAKPRLVNCLIEWAHALTS